MRFHYAVGMTPLRLRLFILAFFAVAAAISFNALYLQEAPRLAGTAIRASEKEQQSRPSAATASLPQEDVSTAGTLSIEPQPSNATQPRVAATPESKPDTPISAELVRAIQRELTRRGYDPGAINGELDIGTRAAIIAYEFDEGLPLKGEPSEAVLKSLIFGAAAGKSGLGPGPADRFERRRDLVIQVQDMLAQMGYLTGPSDGQFDSETRDAIRKFENDRELSGNGRLTARVLLELIIANGRRFNEVG